MGYLTNFIVYTMAMVGVMMFAVFIFKKTTGIGKTSGAKYLKVVDTMSIAPRKMLYIIEVGEEKFLIAGDSDKTTLISKLNSDLVKNKTLVYAEAENPNFETKTFSEMMQNKNYTDNRNSVSEIYNYKKQSNSVMKNLAQKMSSISVGKD